MNPIENAVLPLKSEAVARAEKEANAVVAEVAAKLEAHGWDAKAYAPCPRSFGMGQNEYRQKYALYCLVSSLTKSDPNVYYTGRIDAPHIVVMSDEMVARFVDGAKEDAAAQYDAFVAKLNAKIGEVQSATLKGNHVWSYSVLTVVTASGETQNWKTQSIWNRSKYGRPFAQWPTRKVK